MVNLNIEKHSGFKTTRHQVKIRGLKPLTICSLSDPGQYYDPKGVAQKLGISPAWWSLFGLLWPSARYLANELANYQPGENHKMLEIGCGLALPSLVSHAYGWNITASDQHPLAEKFLRYNLQINGLDAGVKYRYGQWGEDLASPTELGLARRVNKKYHFIMGSDLLYEDDMPKNLSDYIDEHAMPAAEVWIVDANRGYKNRFSKKMALKGFKVIERINLNQEPCISGKKSYRGRLVKYRREAV